MDKVTPNRCSLKFVGHMIDGQRVPSIAGVTLETRSGWGFRSKPLSKVRAKPASPKRRVYLRKKDARSTTHLRPAF
jgi:hypothetical protein